MGAKLQLRFPKHTIQNQSSSTADQQTDRDGDFFVGTTVFHVTVAPAHGLYEKCRRNIAKGLQVYVVVLEDAVVGVRQNAEGLAPGKVSVASIESFVSQNIEELSEFAAPKLKDQFRALLEKYNERVDAIEIDKSLLIDIPPQLRA